MVAWPMWSQARQATPLEVLPRHNHEPRHRGAWHGLQGRQAQGPSALLLLLQVHLQHRVLFDGPNVHQDRDGWKLGGPHETFSTLRFLDTGPGGFALLSCGQLRASRANLASFFSGVLDVVQKTVTRCAPRRSMYLCARSGPCSGHPWPVSGTLGVPLCQPRAAQCLRGLPLSGARP